VNSVELLATGQEFAFRQDGDRVLVFGLPEVSPDPIATVVKITFAEAPVFTSHPA